MGKWFEWAKEEDAYRYLIQGDAEGDHVGELDRELGRWIIWSRW